MKKRSVISGIIVLLFVALLPGSAKNAENAGKKGNSEEKGEGFVREEDDKELFVVSGWYVSCAVDDGYIVYIPELPEGEGAVLTADVDVNISNYDIRNMKAFQITTLDDIAARVNAPEIIRGEDYSDKHLLAYSDGDDRYHIIKSFNEVEVLKNGQEYLHYGTNSNIQDELEPFWTSLSTETEAMITPSLTETEILNMTDDDFAYYANMQMKGQLADQPYIVCESENLKFENESKNSTYAESHSSGEEDEQLELAVQKYIYEKSLRKESDEYSCIGEYLIKEADGITFRRYFILGSNLDMDNYLYSACLFVDEWYVSPSGVIDYVREPELIRMIEGSDIPVQVY